MLVSTDILATPDLFLVGDPVSRRQREGGKFEPVEKAPWTTRPSDPDLSGSTALTGDQEGQKKFEPPMARVLPPINADSTPLQIWEGTVIEVDHAACVMHVVLNAKIGQMPRHTGEIDLEWVAEQDEDLVRPGAVFYLTLFKRTKRGSIENAQELRFRRRPSWSAVQLKQIEEEAATLLSKMRALPTSA